MAYSTLGRLGDIAEDQWGLVTLRRAKRAGVSTATLKRLSDRDSVLERVAHGVYRLTGSPPPDHIELRAAWIQLAPEIPAWERQPKQGVVSHRSAAALYELGDLPAGRHEFTVDIRKQSRRRDVRLHHRQLNPSESLRIRGLLVTRPTRTVSDLLLDREEPEAVAQVVADAIRGGHEHPGAFADALAPFAKRFGFRQGDGLSLLRWLLDLVRDPQAPEWMDEARRRSPARPRKP